MLFLVVKRNLLVINWLEWVFVKTCFNCCLFCLWMKRLHIHNLVIQEKILFYLGIVNRNSGTEEIVAPLLHVHNIRWTIHEMSFFQTFSCSNSKMSKTVHMDILPNPSYQVFWNFSLKIKVIQILHFTTKYVFHQCFNLPFIKNFNQY